MGDRAELLRRLRKAGQEEEDIQAALRDGRAPTLAVELALGGAGRHTLNHVARASGLRPALVRELMQASGRPSPRPRERVYTDEDVEMAKVVRRFLDAGLPSRGLLEVARVLSHGMANTAESVRRLAGEALLQPGDSEFAVGLRYTRALDELGPLISSMLDYQFRAQLRDGIRGELVTEAERESGRLEGTRDMTVSFADLVDYTRLGERLPAEELGHIAGRLTRLALAAARKPVVLVKTIGDAAMFASPDPDPLLDGMVTLVESVEAEGEEFPNVRVGAAYGPATNRAGDWFGGTVNLASRVTDAAKPGRILATQAVQELTADRPWKRGRRRSLKGVDGRVRLFGLERRAD
ncbi:MAG TPA: adenylate cyclase regulatory domain-containing protein [Thermoleophilaceae bacterium]|nr:adenylate cyclase regulatory domain-containing protein [Thermoleophilaceae bacterium]